MAKKTSKTKTKKTTAAQRDTHHQMRAVVLFAVALLMMCIAIIPGENVWTWMHNALLGLFSFSAYLLPIALGAYAIALALDKDSRIVNARIIE